jgi:hypothetical protein
MSDPEFDEESDRPKPDAVRSRGRRLLGFALLAFLGLWLLGFPGCYHRPYTCAVCRMDRVDHHLLGLRWSRLEETDCSRWYRENVEQSLVHAWVKGTCCQRIGIPGLFGGYGCIIGGPLTGLSRTVQTTIYEHFENRLEAKRLFIRLGQTDDESYRTWKTLMGWVDEGYPGTWHDWWEQHRAE